MKKFATLAAASALVASTGFAHAGGANIIVTEPEPVVVLAPTSSVSLGGMGTGGAVAAILGVVLVAAALSSSGSH
ncbi:MAG: hypothetical protein ACK4RN_17390 [Pseudorhodobacter sp.]